MRYFPGNLGVEREIDRCAAIAARDRSLQLPRIRDGKRPDSSTVEGFLAGWRTTTTNQAVAFEEVQAVTRRRRLRIWLPVAVVAILLAAGSTAALAQAPTDAQIASIVVTANQVDIDAGKYAERHAHAADVKAFARQMVTDHTGVNKQAAALAKQEQPWSSAPENVGDMPSWALDAIKERY